MNDYDPAGQLKRSLKRAGLMILIMLVMAAAMMAYFTYRFNNIYKNAPIPIFTTLGIPQTH